MPIKTAAQKMECLNPNTGRQIKIEKKVYDLFSKAIINTLKKHQPLSYTQIVEGIQDCLKQQQTKFDGSVSWYAVTVKHDLHARGIIEVFSQKGRKLNRLSK